MPATMRAARDRSLVRPVLDRVRITGHSACGRAAVAMLLCIDQAIASVQTGLDITQKQRTLQRTRDEQEVVVTRLINEAGETKGAAHVQLSV
jgi:hypothetical protein